MTNAVCFLSFDHFIISEGQTVKKGHLRLTLSKALLEGGGCVLQLKGFSSVA